ncbi:hypothetical protein HDV62DRAFT_64485 [Trichoderma sp. SZMC 28011]
MELDQPAAISSNQQLRTGPAVHTRCSELHAYSTNTTLLVPLTCTGTAQNRSTGAQKQHDKTPGSRPQETRRCPDGLDQDSPARVAAIGAISGVTWTDPTSRDRVLVPAIQRPCPIWPRAKGMASQLFLVAFLNPIASFLQPNCTRSHLSCARASHPTSHRPNCKRSRPAERRQ